MISEVNRILNEHEAAFGEFKPPIKREETSANVSKPKTATKGYGKPFSPPTVGTFSETGGKPRSACIFCNLFNHSSKDCKKYSTSDDRRDQLRATKRCFICLEEGHIGRRNGKVLCPHADQVHCQACQRTGNHHPVLCQRLYGKAVQQATAQRNVPPKNSQNNLQESVVQHSHAEVAHSSSSVPVSTLISVGQQGFRLLLW